jgi:type II secretory pathway pseudopilin PulG
MEQILPWCLKYALITNNMRPVSLKKGFTLVELLLYVGVASIMLLAVSVFLSTLLTSRVKNQTIAEVEQQGMLVMRLIGQTVRNAESVNSPAQGASGAALSLDVIPGASDPTLFDLFGGAVRITEGVGSPVALTNSRVVATALVFENLSRTNTPGVVRVSFTLTHVNPEGKNEYDFTKTFYTSAALRYP